MSDGGTLGEGTRVRTGLEVLLARGPGDLAGKRIGLLSHAAAVDGELNPAARRLLRAPGFSLTTLFAPEHGLAGAAQAGAASSTARDPQTGLPIVSLYRDPPPLTAGRTLDEAMRDFDLRLDGKGPRPADLKGIDVLLIDLIDVGTRIYTYAATMLLCLAACAEAGVPVLVLDRPNPLGGEAAEGPVLDHPAFATYLGMVPIPLRHGLTMGELARFGNGRFGRPAADLTVVPLAGWRRSMTWEETGLPWVMPSPNMPTEETAAVYPGQVLLEGTNLSEGRGTTRPFELLGAPWLDGVALADELNGQGLPGVRFRPVHFCPAFSKFAGHVCAGVQLHVFDRRQYRPVTTTVVLLAAVIAARPADFRFHERYFDCLAGGAALRSELQAGRPAQEIGRPWDEENRRFVAEVRRFLLY